MARKRARDSKASKEAILAAARDVFVAKGFRGASVSEIARRAGLAKGTVFLHFGSKDNLLYCLMEQRFAALSELYEQTVESPEMSALEQLRQLTRAESWLKQEVSDVSRTVLSMWAGLPRPLRSRLEGLLKSNYELFRTRIAGLFRELLEADEVKGVSVEALAAAFMAALDGLVIRARVSPTLRPSAARVGDALGLIFVEGLRRVAGDKLPGSASGESKT